MAGTREAMLQLNRCISRVEAAEARVLASSAEPCPPLRWREVALANAISQLVQKLNACAESVPSTKDKLIRLTKARISGQKLYVFDPRTVIGDLKDRRLIQDNAADDALKHLSLFVPPPDAVCVPKEEWPDDGQYLWRKALPTLDSRGLALWACNRAAVQVRCSATEIVEGLLAADGLCKVDSDGRLQCDWERQAPPPELKHQVPWRIEGGGFKKDSVTVQAALLIDLPHSNPAYERVQQVRKDHDPAFERWMPHINLIYPFVKVDALDAAGLQRRLQDTEHGAFDLELTSVGVFEFKNGKNFHLRPSSDSEAKLQNLYDQIVNVLPLSPTGNWQEAPSTQAKGKGKGKGKSKGRGTDQSEDAADAEGDHAGKFVAHMTVAKVESSSSIDADTLQKLLLEPGGGVVRMRVSKVSWCVRTDSTPFIEAVALSLKQQSSEQEVEAATCDLQFAEHQLQRAVLSWQRRDSHAEQQLEAASDYNNDQGNKATDIEASVMDEGVNAKQRRKPGGGGESRGEKNAGSECDKEVRRRRWLASHRREQWDRDSVRKAREMLRSVQRDLKSQSQSLEIA